MLEIDDLIPHMRRVQAAERDMRDLSLTWQMIEASAAISCPEDVQSILPTLTQTRERFDELQRRLVHRLAAENLAELQDELAARAQCAIDILVRNLYERTADVGFLATDETLRTFCSLTPEARSEQREQLQRRLAEYRAKYSVYDDVILLDPLGEVLVRLDEDKPVVRSTDAIVREAAQVAGYVERYGATDLAGHAEALLYAHRIEEAGRIVGVLVLRFRFADEMARIFASVADARQQFAIVLIDNAQRVVASNDLGHVPLGIRLPAAQEAAVDVVSFAGREYLAIACATHGYQGYMGPGWRGFAMVSLLTAFRTRTQTHDDHSVSLDNAELVEVQNEASTINRNLRRVVWNGRLMARAEGYDQARLKAVLTQINLAGSRTRARVNDAVNELHSTSLARMTHQANELARLAADIMDRNLYERANDCRWWALSPLLREALAQEPGAAADQGLTAMLEHINSLYTVYARLVAFDAQGVICAASCEDSAQPLVGARVEAELVSAVQRLQDTQRYAVTPFGPGVLTRGEPAYVYLAAVRAPQSQRVAGGIAIVFNAVTELTVMLKEVMGDRSGVAAFVDQAGHVIASNDAGLKPGALLPFDTASGIVAHDGVHFAVAQCHAAGYREFKINDGYRNDVRAVVAMRLGRLERRRARDVETVAIAATTPARGRTLELAVVRVGAGLYGLGAGNVSEALAPATVLRAPNADPAVLGLIEVRSQGRPRILQLLSARHLLGAGRHARAGDGVAVVVQTDEGQPALALWVDDVVSVVELAADAVQPPPLAAPEGNGALPLLSGLVDLPGVQTQSLVQILAADRLLAMLHAPSRASVATSASAASPKPEVEDAVAD
jgi:chemotaxis signal transduction protein